MLGGWELRIVSWVLFNALKNGNKERKRLHLIFFSGKPRYIFLHIFFGGKHMGWFCLGLTYWLGSWFMASINWWPATWSSSTWVNVGKFLLMKLVNPKLWILEDYVWIRTTKHRKMFRYLITTFKKRCNVWKSIASFLVFFYHH